MKRLLAVFALALLAAGCGPRGGGELRVLNWSDYMPEDVIKAFEEREGVTIRLDTYDDPDQMLSRLKAGGDSEFDVVIVSDYLIGQMARDGLIVALDKSKISNISNLDPQFANPAYDPEGKHSVVYQWGTTGLVYRQDQVSGPVDSWAVLFDPARSVGNFLLLTESREQMGAALRFLGKSVNSTEAADLNAARDLLIGAKNRSRGFAGGTDAVQQVLGGNVAVAVAYSGDAIRASGEDQRVRYVIPREGGTLWTDNLTILSKADEQQRERAYRFINYLLEPETAAKLSNGIGYGTPVPAALPNITAKDNPVVYPPAEVRQRLELLADLGLAADRFNAAWSAVRTE